MFSDEQKTLLTAWGNFLKASIPVVEHMKNDAAQRYIMLFDQLPGDQTSEWSSQWKQVSEFVNNNIGAIQSDSPQLLSRDTRDAAFTTASVDCSVNVAQLLYGCNEANYAHALWKLVQAMAPGSQIVAKAPESSTHEGSFLQTVIQTVHTIAEQQAKDEPLPTDVQPSVICERIIKCLRSPQMENLMGTMMQQAMNCNPGEMEAMIGNLLGGMQNRHK